MSKPSITEQQNEKLLYVNFNHDQDCFACSGENGFVVFNTDPCKAIFKRDMSNRGIAMVEMLNRSNIMALVGGGKIPRFPSNQITLWDDVKCQTIAEFNFRSPVRGVKLTTDHIIVILEHKIYLYHFNNLKSPAESFETISNPNGICSIASDEKGLLVLAYLGLQPGSVQIYDVKKGTKQAISAHKSSVACLTLNRQGTLLATASEKGTLIRVFDTSNGQCIQELRRGLEQTTVLSLSFNKDSKWLAVSSKRGTVHVFAINHNTTNPINTDEHTNHTNHSNHSNHLVSSVNPTSTFNVMILNNILPQYFQSEWSVAQFRLPLDTRSVVGFHNTEENTLMIATYDGVMYKVKFENNQCTVVFEEKFNKNF